MSPVALKVAVVTAAWFAIILSAVAAGVFATEGGPPVALGVAVVVPVLAVLALLAWARSFQQWVRTLDLSLLTMLQAWRIVGFAFLALWSVDRLPATFAVPAGLGDIATGLAAPLVAVGLATGTPVALRAFYWWTAFGIADLLVAVPLGILHSPSALGVLAGDGADLTAMAEFPMSLIPTFIVPAALVLHVISLANARSATGQVTAHLSRAPHSMPAR